jgi:hypothetical protein
MSDKLDYLKRYESARKSGSSSKKRQRSGLVIQDDGALEDAPWQGPASTEDELLRDLASGEGPALVGVSRHEAEALIRSAPAAAQPLDSGNGARGRLDSSDDEGKPAPAHLDNSKGARGRLDSSDDEGKSAPAHLDNSDGEGDDWRAPKRVKQDDEVMASGHRAGLRLASDFRSDSKTLNRAQFGDSTHELLEGNRATVFRDKSGQVVDAEEQAAADAVRAERERVEKEQALFQVRTGAAQHLEAQERAERLESLKAKPVSRRIDDADLDRELREQILEGDPMAELMGRSAGSQKDATSRTGKPLYTGPPAPPNRFGLTPGYRWDGTDRSNGFEKRWLVADAERRNRAAAIRAQAMGGVRG